MIFANVFNNILFIEYLLLTAFQCLSSSSFFINLEDRMLLNLHFNMISYTKDFLKAVIKACTRWRFKWVLQVISDLKPQEYIQDFNQKFKFLLKIPKKLKTHIKKL